MNELFNFANQKDPLGSKNTVSQRASLQSTYASCPTTSKVNERSLTEIYKDLEQHTTMYISTRTSAEEVVS